MFTKPKCLYSQSANDEVKYDIQVFADRIEFCWIHLRGIGALENSLWAYDGDGMRVWLNALSMDSPQLSDASPENVKESVKIPLDFYPLCESSLVTNILGPDQVCTAVLMDKGIIIGVEHEAAIRSNLPFVLFRHATSVVFYFSIYSLSPLMLFSQVLPFFAAYLIAPFRKRSSLRSRFLCIILQELGVLCTFIGDSTTYCGRIRLCAGK